jgi:HEAT repeat protein
MSKYSFVDWAWCVLIAVGTCASQEGTESRQKIIAHLKELASPKLQADYAIPYLLDYTKHSDSEIRERATETLYFWNSSAAPIPANLASAITKRLLELLKDDNPKTRGYAVKGLGKKGENDDKLLAAILGVFEGDSEPSVRIEAAIALGNVGPTAKAAIPTLIKGTKDKNADIRWWSCQALALIPPTVPKSGLTTPTHEIVAKTFVDILKTDKDVKVRGAALFGLSHLGPTAANLIPEAAEVLLKAAQDPALGSLAVQLLEKMGVLKRID